MGHGKIRIDKTCLNCNHVVENKFCPNCGQQNTETRQSFHYLFTHFVEDLTHYDGSFWKTIKALLFKPGRLTKEYLEGKRLKYVPPVKLYIFISFVAFLLPKFLPEYSIFGPERVKKEKESIYLKTDAKDSIYGVSDRNISINSIKELDSLQNVLPENEKISFIEYYGTKTLIKLESDKNQGELVNKAFESFIHTLPKVLFFYMPIFAFFLWLFHDKKKFYYFESGVFTLHYFAFLLLSTTALIIISWFIDLLYYFDFISKVCIIIFLLYSFFYFFRAHSSFYGEQKVISRIKSLALFFINVILIITISVTLFLYSVLAVE